MPLETQPLQKPVVITEEIATVEEAGCVRHIRRPVARVTEKTCIKPWKTVESYVNAKPLGHHQQGTSSMGYIDPRLAQSLREEGDRQESAEKAKLETRRMESRHGLKKARKLYVRSSVPSA
jgi:hypothetical protein